MNAVSSQFLGEIRSFPLSYAPTGWASCNGQLIPISQNVALFQLLGTTFGGDGKSTFALPNLQGSAPVHPGQGPGLSAHVLGESGGEAVVTLLSAQVPGHTHGLMASPHTANLGSPGPQDALGRSDPAEIYKEPDTAAAPQPMAPVILGGGVGGSMPHQNMQPYLTLNFCIALQGVFPPPQ
jgi:microcystin-dependent protein